MVTCSVSKLNMPLIQQLLFLYEKENPCNECIYTYVYISKYVVFMQKRCSLIMFYSYILVV